MGRTGPRWALLFFCLIGGVIARSESGEECVAVWSLAPVKANSFLPRDSSGVRVFLSGWWVERGGGRRQLRLFFSPAVTL